MAASRSQPQLFAVITLKHREGALMADDPFIHITPKETDKLECGDTGGKCPVCGKPLESGFGLAGGGYGVYEYCETHGVITKTQTE